MSPCQFTTILILALFCPISSTAHSINVCSEDFLVEMNRDRNITHCKKLSTLGSQFGWNNHNDSSIDIFFGAKLKSEQGWLAWGVNPSSKPQMVGTRALIGIKQPNGSLTINKYNITSDVKLGCKLIPSEIDLKVSNMKFNYSEQSHYYTIFATIVLSSDYNTSRLNHVWQVGYNVMGNQPGMHPTTLQNVDSSATIDLKRENSTRTVGKHRNHLRTVHGILNIVGWGILLPTGVIVARYFEKFPFRSTWWFRFHVSFQGCGYIIGTVGWAIGIYLGHASKYYTFGTHRMLAIFIFTFTTLQMLALRLRPKKNDDYRRYWNIYHHFLGYALLILISFNIFQGIAILRPDHITWKWFYIGVLCVLGLITTALEIYTWIKFTKMKKFNKEIKKQSNSAPQPQTDTITSQQS